MPPFIFAFDYTIGTDKMLSVLRTRSVNVCWIGEGEGNTPRRNLYDLLWRGVSKVCYEVLRIFTSISASRSCSDRWSTDSLYCTTGWWKRFGMTTYRNITNIYILWSDILTWTGEKERGYTSVLQVSTVYRYMFEAFDWIYAWWHSIMLKEGDESISNV
jgi:hypothetical protein